MNAEQLLILDALISESGDNIFKLAESYGFDSESAIEEEYKFLKHWGNGTQAKRDAIKTVENGARNHLYRKIKSLEN